MLSYKYMSISTWPEFNCLVFPSAFVEVPLDSSTEPSTISVEGLRNESKFFPLNLEMLLFEFHFQFKARAYANVFPFYICSKSFSATAQTGVVFQRTSDFPLHAFWLNLICVNQYLTFEIPSREVVESFYLLLKLEEKNFSHYVR